MVGEIGNRRRDRKDEIGEKERIKRLEKDEFEKKSCNLSVKPDSSTDY
jgi:hypothetical protein